ncbi:MAG: helix-turn-helix transcriptional regulator [Sphaerochaetaceae bacterium]|nr:helix-turn-helix transcriptional regulator [Sphaerochaetaceae bacterium]NLO59568.1 helix-turn-helix transcriptional regulator [Spirochaetales bacterium]MDD2405038.1 helix-turn-helix transcriptional regulator [Sphaerochaetaceae bacterium]MDD3669939.1 helix-turn-helix transcriptional regulator [Sphaerochaetaceae bacterium]MDD4259540.1 helix-turn-helix transcriptional regulator [Sphaerochaetaceae bacterium]
MIADLEQGLTILLYMFAFATGCMTMVLSVVFHIRESYEWTKYFIIFHSSLLLAIVLQVLNLFVDIFVSDTVGIILSYVLRGLLAANVSFLMVFIPYFTTWVIAQPWRNPFKAFFFIVAAGYTALSVLGMIFENITSLGSWMVIVFCLVIFFAIGLIIKSLKTISRHDVRTVCQAIIILSFVMMPLLIVSVFVPRVRYISYPLYFMAFSIIILVYLFIYFRKIPKVIQKMLTLDNLEPYHITEREFSVIVGIKEGKTNKEIADKLDISVNTVNNHVANIYAKMQVRSRIDLLNVLSET